MEICFDERGDILVVDTIARNRVVAFKEWNVLVGAVRVRDQRGEDQKDSTEITRALFPGSYLDTCYLLDNLLIYT